MARLETRGVVLVQVDPTAGAPAVTRAVGALSFVPVPASIPAGYPVRPHEVLRVAWIRAGGWHALAVSDLTRLFALALGLSRLLPGTTALGVRRDFDGAMVVKAFRDGRPAFKLGTDPDHELPYPVMAGNPEDLRTLLAAHDVRDRALVDALIARLAQGEPGFLQDLLARLGVVLVLPTVAELLGNAGVRVQEFVDERSPLNRA